MHFLLDEDVPEPIGEFLAERGHDVLYVKNAYGKGTADPVVATGGNYLGATVVTFNHSDFAALVRAVPSTGRQEFRNLSRITFRCHQRIGLRRMKELIEVIEAVHAVLQRRSDKRMRAVIGETRLSFDDMGGGSVSTA